MSCPTTWRDVRSTRLLCLDSEGLFVAGRKIRFPTNRCFEILVYLAAHQHEVSRAELAEVVWGNTRPASARHSLANALYTIRRLAPDVKFCSSRLSVSLEHASIYCDIVAAHALIKAKNHDALFEVYRQPLMFTYTAATSEFFAEWVDDQRKTLHDMVCRVVSDRFRELEREGRWEACADFADQLDRLGIHNGAAGIWIQRATLVRESGIELSDRVPETYSRNMLLSRVDELRTLQQSYLRATTSGPAFTLVSGDPGIGKSHLCAHFLRLAALKGARVIQARASRPDRRHSYSVILRAMTEGSSVRTRERLNIIDPGFQEIVASQFTSKREVVRTDVTRAILGAIEALALDGPLTLYIDDYQWCDSASRKVLEDIIDQLEGVPVHIVLAARNGLSDSFAQLRSPRFSSRKSEIQLLGLPEQSAKLLAQDTAVIHGFRLDAHATDLLFKRAGGNPFYVIETVASLRSERSEDSIAVALPNSVSASIVARVKPLTRVEKALLARLAVAGRPVSLSTLRELVPKRSKLSTVRLEALGLVAVKDGRVAFSHDLVREAVYQTVPARVRRLFHREFANFLIRENGSAAEIFWHLKQSGDDQASARYARIAAEHADQIRAYKEAEYFYKLAVEYAETSDQRTTALERLALFYMRARQPQSAEAVWKNLADKSEDDSRSRAYLAWKVAALASEDQKAAVDISIVIEEVEQLMTMARENGFRESFVPAVYLLGELALDLERTDLLERVVSLVGEYMSSVDEPEMVEELALLEAQLLSYGGDQVHALALIQKYEPASERSATFRARWLAAKAVLLMNMGRAPESVKAYEEVFRLSRESMPEFCEGLMNNYGLVLWECGRYEDAKKLWLSKLADPRPPAAARQVYMHVNLGFLYHDLGEFDASLAHAVAALNQNVSRGSSSVVANSWAIIGLCSLASGRFDEAERSFSTIRTMLPDVMCGFSDSTYPEVFLARFVGASDPKSALARLEKAIAWYARRSASSFHTLRLEHARLIHQSYPRNALDEVAEVEVWAINAGAFAIADQAQLCRRYLRSRAKPDPKTG